MLDGHVCHRSHGYVIYCELRHHILRSGEVPHSRGRDSSRFWMEKIVLHKGSIRVGDHNVYCRWLKVYENHRGLNQRNKMLSIEQSTFGNLQQGLAKDLFHKPHIRSPIAYSFLLCGHVWTSHLLIQTPVMKTPTPSPLHAKVDILPHIPQCQPTAVKHVVLFWRSLPRQA